MATFTGENSARLLTIGAVAVFLLATTTSGHNWGGDFSQYVHHAVNLVEGRSYTDIGVIRNASNFLGPDAYPPLLPLLLAPVYWLFGLDWFAFKAVVIACFCLALYVLTLMAGRDLGRGYEPVLVAILAFNPYIWEQNDKILSDFPFLMICLLTLYTVDRRYNNGGAGYRDTAGSKPWFGVLLGLLLYLCIAAREVGAIVVAAVVFFEVFHFRKISLVTGMALVIFLVLSGIQHVSLKSPATNAVPPSNAESKQQPAGVDGKQVRTPAPASHLDVIKETLNLPSIKLQLTRYAESAREIWPRSENRYVQAAGWTAFTLTLVFAAAGYLRAVIAGPGVMEIFVAGYLVAIVIFGGYQGLRYLLPVIPFLFLYAFRFHSDLLRAGFRRLMYLVAGVFLVATTATYASGFYSISRVTPMGITSAPAEMFFDHVRRHTPEDSIFVFQKPRVLALLTGRRASAWPYRHSPEQLLDYSRDIGADYLVVSNILWNGNCRPVRSLPVFPEQLSLDYRNDYFLVYKLQTGAVPGGDTLR